MEQVRDLNMEADDMQVVLSAISGVSKRIKEVAQTHKPLFGGEHFKSRWWTSKLIMILYSLTLKNIIFIKKKEKDLIILSSIHIFVKH